MDTSSVGSLGRQSKNTLTMSSRSVSPISPSRSEGHCQKDGQTFGRLGYRHPDNDSGCFTDSSTNFSSILSNLTSHDTSSNNLDENLSDSWSEEHSHHRKLCSRFRSTCSLRKAFRNLSFSTRSLSCTAGERDKECEDEDEDDDDSTADIYEKRVSFKNCPKPQKGDQKKCSTLIARRSKTPPPQRRILRQPVSYLYLKGMSGLPTQRVPRSSVCCPQGYR